MRTTIIFTAAIAIMSTIKRTSGQLGPSDIGPLPTIPGTKTPQTAGTSLGPSTQKPEEMKGKGLALKLGLGLGFGALLIGLGAVILWKKRKLPQRLEEWLPLRSIYRRLGGNDNETTV